MVEENRNKANDWAPWWGEFAFQPGDTARWEIGPIRTAVQRRTNEWLIAYESLSHDQEKAQHHFEMTGDDLMEGDNENLNRFVGESDQNQLHLTPALADRAVVVRPMVTFSVPAGNSSTIFVSTPVWIKIASPTPDQVLLEFPVLRLPDTWFGPSTMEGELCYAIRTHGRLNFSNIPLLPHRAVTQIDILNNTDAPLVIERLKLPVPYLSLFIADDGLLWTEAVAMEQVREGSFTAFNTAMSPPEVVSGAKLVTSPRETPPRGMLISAFSGLKIAV